MEIKEEEFNTQTFVEIFQKLSTHYKDKAAITGSGKTYTYEDVNLYSNYLAKHLIDSGVCSGDVVMIKLSRRPETLIAILGIWKAGGAYLFLDDSYPEARNNKLINETGSQIIIDSDYISRVPLKKDPELIDRSERDGLAVLVYTSGSTSKPKGVKLLHRNVMASISNSWRLGFNEKDVMCVFPSYAFVASIYDTFGQLVRGGSLNLIPEEKRRNIDLIEEHFITNKITIAYLPP
ncbi:MAG: AMP-binding protein, partial [Eubacterium sp.]|nr:AMP-binding protein [Eubacterium sp.]